MQRTLSFEEKYNLKLKGKLIGVEFSEASLEEFIHDKKEELISNLFELRLKEIEDQEIKDLFADNLFYESFKKYFFNTALLNNSTNIGPEEFKFSIWLFDQVKNHGLTDMHVSKAFSNITYNNNQLNIDYIESNNREEYYKELNTINKAVKENKGVRITEL